MKVNAEGFAEMEFIVPDDLKASHPGKETDSRILAPYISYDQKTPVVIDNTTREKSLHVVKTMPSQTEIDALNLRKGIELGKLPGKAKVVEAGHELVWGGKVNVEFRQKVVQISEKLNINPDHLMSVMAIETNKTFDPAIDNGLGYVGLIQFGSAAASDLNTTTDALKKMTAIQQLDYVYMFLNKKKDKLTSFTRLYLAVIMPAYIDHAEEKDFVVFDAKSSDATRRKGYWQNALYQREKGESANVEYVNELGKNKTGWTDGKTYMWEFTEVLDATYTKGLDYAISVNETKSLAAVYAQKILYSGRVTFDKLHSSPPKGLEDDPANAWDNINDAAQDKPTKTSSYSHVEETDVKLNLAFWMGFYKLSQIYTLNISEISGGEHGKKESRHYSGIAIDITEINGIKVDINNPYNNELRRKGKELGATEDLGPPDADHGTHVHLGWPRK